MDIFRLSPSLDCPSEEAMRPSAGCIQRGLIEEQIARLRAMLLPGGQTGDRPLAQLASLVAEGEWLTR